MARQEGHRKYAEWQQRLRRVEKSGLTVARFCARERVAVPTFWHWRRKGLRPIAASKTDPCPVFVPVLMRELGNSPRGVSEGGA